MDDLNLAELGLGGNPALVELGLGTSNLVKVDNMFSTALSGIWREERFGCLDCCTIKVDSSLSSV